MIVQVMYRLHLHYSGWGRPPTDFGRFGPVNSAPHAILSKRWQHDPPILYNKCIMIVASG